MTFKLQPHAAIKASKGPVLLVVMDGVGIAEDSPGNAVTRANTPVLDRLLASPLSREIKAHGKAVGLPSDDDMGNSEVGHNALGAGRIFAQGAKLVAEAIADESIYNSANWQEIERIGKLGHTVHLIGLLSDGNIHSHMDHALALLARLASKKVQSARVHVLLDGRDVHQRSALNYIATLETQLTSHQSQGLDYRIASGGGRMCITMDRYNADWNMVERGYACHVKGIAPQFESAQQAIETAYQDESINDQYIPPFVIAENGAAIGVVEDGDAMVLFNFRGDRAIEFSSAMESEQFDRFDRGQHPSVYYCGMLQYDGDLFIPKNYLVEPPQIDKTMVEYMCAEGLQTFAVSETQKFGHVTFFWNGNRSGYICEQLESYVEVPSDVIPFDQAPEMKAHEITEQTIKLLKQPGMRFGRINYANGDMVGHTGNFDACIKAVETVDACLAELEVVVKAVGGTLIVTADHGNADAVFSVKNGVKTAVTSHTLAPVPFVIVGADESLVWSDVENAGLANVAATVFNLLGFEAPDDYLPSLVQPR